jgi:hypothetical protein
MNDNRIMFGTKEEYGEVNKNFKFFEELYDIYGDYPYGTPNIDVDGEDDYGIETCYLITGTDESKKPILKKAILYWWGKEDTEGLICDINHDEYWPIEHMRHYDHIEDIDAR